MSSNREKRYLDQKISRDDSISIESKDEDTLGLICDLKQSTPIDLLLPEEILDLVMSHLSNGDLRNLTKIGNERIEYCANKALKKRCYIVVIGNIVDCEVVSIKKDSISIINTTIPLLPKRLVHLQGTQLPNHDLLVSGGRSWSDRNGEYLKFDQASNQWKKVGTMKKARYAHSSVLLNGCLYSCGGIDSSHYATSHHEVLNLDGRVEEKKELPSKRLSSHTAHRLNENQYIVIGGYDCSNMYPHNTFIYDVRSDDWKEEPSLLLERNSHCSCVIQSDDGTPESIIVIGGYHQGIRTNTTEIFKISEKKWIQGPPCPCGIANAACASLPPTMKSVSNIGAVVVGGDTEKERFSSDVYGLNRSLTNWKHLGKIKKGRIGHIVFPL